MMEQDTLGKVSIAPQVLAAVAVAAALAVPGVARLSSYRPVSMERFIRRSAVEPGVSVAVDEDGATFDLYLVLVRGVSLLDVSRTVQLEVERAVRDTVGMTVRDVNIHVDDVAVNPASELR